MWQILSSDYDTQASYYGVKKACEPLHVHLNLANYRVDVVNTTTTPRAGLTVTAKVYTLANALVSHSTERADVAADSTAAVTHSIYISLLPGESRAIEIEYPATAGHSAALTLRGWNAVPQIIAVK